MDLTNIIMFPFEGLEPWVVHSIEPRTKYDHSNTLFYQFGRVTGQSGNMGLTVKVALNARLSEFHIKQIG